MKNKPFARIVTATMAAVLVFAGSLSTPNAMADTTAHSAKKGVASRYIKQAAVQAGTDDIQKLSDLNVNWAYNWSITKPADMHGIQFVPMLWGASDVTPANIAALTQGKANGTYDTLLGFNEPDGSGQANMTTSQAIALWPQLESTGLRLGSPAVSDTYQGQVWLSNFMTKAGCDRTQAQINQHIPNPNCRVDFVTVHLYRSWTLPQAATAQIRTDLINLRTKYDLPVWVTEIGTIDTNTTGGSSNLLWLPPSATYAQQFMSQVTGMMNDLTWVEKYAWMSDNMCDLDQPYLPNRPYLYSSLYNCHDVQTGLGQLYTSL